MITVEIMSFTKKVKEKENNMNQSRIGINQVLSLVHRSKTKEGRTPPLNANNPPGKDSAVGINGFEGAGPKWLLPKRNPCYVLEESRI